MLCLIIIATLVAATNAQYCERVIDYCSICADHIMCNYTSSDYGPACGSPVYGGLNCDMEKQYILDVHNDIRRRVAKGLEKRGNPGPQPPAANMRKLEWDEELARIAQRWVNQCEYYIANRCINVERFNVSGNTFRTVHYPAPSELWGSPYWDNTVDHWYRLVDQFNSNNVSPYVPGTAEEYTTIVWAGTYTVGCAFNGYLFPEGDYQKFYLCLYGPEGNIAGGNSSVYQIGPACSACPANAECCEDGLCCEGDFYEEIDGCN